MKYILHWRQDKGYISLKVAPNRGWALRRGHHVTGWVLFPGRWVPGAWVVTELDEGPALVPIDSGYLLAPRLAHFYTMRDVHVYPPPGD